jgi:hypothetical protein
MRYFRTILSLCLLASSITFVQTEVRIPAFTAYTLPDTNALRISKRNGVTRWTHPGRPVKNNGFLSR